MMSLKEDEIKDRIDYAKKLHAPAVKMMDEVEELFKGEYINEQELKDAGLEAVKPVRPQAILRKILAMLAVRADLNSEVMPKKIAQQEEKTCTKLERWLDGYQKTMQWEVRRPLFRDWRFWFLLRGRGDLELRFIEENIDTDKLPIRTVMDDPKTIFPVWGRDGLGYYAKVFKVPAWELMEEFRKGYEAWKTVDLSSKKFDEEVEVKEYWDEDWHAAYVDDKEVYSKENPFGFIPLAEARAEGTPLLDMEWASQSILQPIMNGLKQQAVLMGKTTNAVEVYYWPEFLGRTTTGEVVKIYTGPGAPKDMPPGIVDLIEIKPTPNQALVELLNNWLQSDINLYAVPEIAWGIEPKALQSGFAISQVLGQVMDRIQDKKEDLEMAAGWHFGNVLRAVEKFGKEKSAKFPVTVAPEKEGGRRDIVEIGAEDVDGHYQVEVTITPEMPTDEVLKMRIVQMARTPGADGNPFLPDSYLRREVMEVTNPDEVEEELEKQLMEATDPIIKAHKRKIYREKWMKEQGIKEEELAELEAEAGGAMGLGGMPGQEELMAALEGLPGAPPTAPEEQYPGMESPGGRLYPELEELM